VEVWSLRRSRTIPTSDPRKGYRLSHLCVFVPLGENDVIASRLLQKEKWMAEISRFERTSLVVVSEALASRSDRSTPRKLGGRLSSDLSPVLLT